MDKIAFLFPGQGAHFVGMGEGLYNNSPSAQGVFDAIEFCRPGTLDQCFKGPKEVLNQTLNTQPCIFAVSLAMVSALKNNGYTPDGVAGFSLGEISALVVSDILNLEDGLTLVTRRGKAMENAKELISATMVAVLKIENNVVEDLCRSFKGARAVNYNCPKQLVVAIDLDSVSEFVEAVKSVGGKAIPLGLPGGFHSFYMDTAAKELKETTQTLDFSKPSIPLYSNESASPYPILSEEIESKVLNQINHPVHWEKTIRQMKADGFTLFIEVGPGKTLSGFMKKIDPELKVIHADTLI